VICKILFSEDTRRCIIFFGYFVEIETIFILHLEVYFQKVSRKMQITF